MTTNEPDPPNEDEPDLPILPYGAGEEATAGWSGSDTSHERADRERDEGTVARRQRQTLASLDAARSNGLTWKELGALQSWHHGQSSSVLSVLHMDSRIARLAERRDKCHVYVLPEYVQDREVQPHGGRRGARAAEESVAQRDLHRAEQKLAAIRALTAQYALLDSEQVLEVLDEE